MFKIGQKVIDKQTNQICTVTQTYDNFCLVMHKSGVTTGRFNWELEEYSFIKHVLRKVGEKNGRE